MKNLYAVYDKKAKNYDGFMVLDYDAVAVRAFAQACNTNEIFKQWPEDFELYKIGTINQEKGIIKQEKEFLAAGLSFITKPKNEKNTK